MPASPFKAHRLWSAGREGGCGTGQALLGDTPRASTHTGPLGHQGHTHSGRAVSTVLGLRGRVPSTQNLLARAGRSTPPHHEGPGGTGLCRCPQTAGATAGCV